MYKSSLQMLRPKGVTRHFHFSLLPELTSAPFFQRQVELLQWMRVIIFSFSVPCEVEWLPANTHKQGEVKPVNQWGNVKYIK